MAIQKKKLTAAGHLNVLVTAIQNETHAFANIGPLVDEEGNPTTGKCGLLYAPYGKSTLTFHICYFDGTIIIRSLQCEDAYWKFVKTDNIWSGIQRVEEDGICIPIHLIYKKVLKPVQHALM